MRYRVKPRVEVKVSRYHLEQRSYGQVVELEGTAGVWGSGVGFYKCCAVCVQLSYCVVVELEGDARA